MAQEERLPTLRVIKDDANTRDKVQHLPVGSIQRIVAALMPAVPVHPAEPQLGVGHGVLGHVAGRGNPQPPTRVRTGQLQLALLGAMQRPATKADPA